MSVGTLFISLLATALLLSGCALLGSTVTPAPDPSAAAEVRKVAAYELVVEAPRELRTLLLTHLDLARFQQTEASQQLSSIELDRLAATTPIEARGLLETAGFFNAEVLLERRPGALEQVVVKVTPGPLTEVASLLIQYSGAIEADAAAAAALTRGWTLDKGDGFSQDAWSSAKSALLVRARAGGYPLARWASSVARVNAEANTADLSLLLDSGPLFRLGELRIEGLRYQSEQSVRYLAGFTPGAPYDERTLLDFQERLQKTLLFDSVNVELQIEPGRDQAAVVLVRVREAPRQQATTGIGYDANTGQRVTLEYINRVPFGLPLRSRAKLDLGRDLRAAELELSSHPLPDMQRNLASLAFEQERSTDKIINSISTRLGRLRETDRDERLIYGELLRSQERSAGSSISSNAVSLNTQWIRRRLDSALLPTDGHQALLLLGAGRADNSASDSGAFGRMQLKLGWYRPLGRHWYANARGELGQVFASDSVGIPEKLLFRAGGDDSVRGYAYRSLGPTRLGVDVGGRVLGTASFELARPLALSLPNYWGAVFVDAGRAADHWNDFKPALGYGVGLRWRSPVGPLRLDVARGQELQKWRLHVSVGIAL